MQFNELLKKRLQKYINVVDQTLDVMNGYNPEDVNQDDIKRLKSLVVDTSIVSATMALQIGIMSDVFSIQELPIQPLNSNEIFDEIQTLTEMEDLDDLNEGESFSSSNNDGEES